MDDLTAAWNETAGTVAERLAQIRARVVVRPRGVAWHEVRSLALASGRWAFVVIRARQTPELTAEGAPATVEAGAVLAAINATAMLPEQVITPEEWPIMAQGLAALRAAGDLTADLVAAIGALPSEAVPEFPGVDYPVLYAAGLITADEAGLKE